MNVGELVGTLRLDGAGFDDDVRRRLRGVEADFRRAGDEAGDRFYRGVDGRLRDLEGRFAAEGADAGAAFGDAAGDEAAAGTESGIGGMLAGLGGAVGGAAMLAGAAIGGSIAVGITGAIEDEASLDMLEAQLGAGSLLAEDAGRAAGELWKAGYGESVADAGSALRALLDGGVLSGDEASQADLEKYGAKLMDIAGIFGGDMQTAANAVGQMLRTGMATDAEQAFDILTRGYQQGTDKAGDMLDTINEFSTQFRSLGLDGESSLALLGQGLQAGARDSDLMANALLEFNVRAKDGSEESASALAALGFNAKDAMDAIANGGDGARTMLAATLDALRGIDDAALQDDLAVKLFGTPAEDLQDALLAMDVGAAIEGGLGNVDGALDDAAAKSTEGWAARAEVMKRRIIGGLKDLAGGILTSFEDGGLEGVGEYLGGLWAEWWPRMREAGEEFFQRAREWIVEEAPGIAREAGSVLNNAGEWLLEAYPGFVERMGEFWGRVINWLAEEGIPALGGWLKTEGGPALWEWIQEAYPRAVEFMAEMWLLLIDWLATTAIPWLYEKGRDLQAALLEWLVVDAAPAMLRGLGDLQEALRDWIEGTAIPWLREKGGDLFGQLVGAAGEQGLRLLEWAYGVPGALGDALLGIAEVVASPFVAAFNTIAEAWNKTVGSLSFTAPDWLSNLPGGGMIAGKGWDVPDLPIFELDGQRADGGPVRARRPYLVGERGPEIFVPDVSGMIIPDLGSIRSAINADLGRSGSIGTASGTFTATPTGSGSGSFDAEGLARLIGRHTPAPVEFHAHGTDPDAMWAKARWAFARARH